MSSLDSFVNRHIGPRCEDIVQMLQILDISSLDDLIEKTVPSQIRATHDFSSKILGFGCSEAEVLTELHALGAKNQVFRSYIGMGYHDCITPPVILRNILEDPRWYTPYTPYQAEVAQGRLEALLNFQTMIIDLTGMEVANSSLLDEATAIAEAMGMCFAINGDASKVFFVSQSCHPQAIAVIQARAEPLGIEIVIGDHTNFNFDRPLLGGVIQYPATDGEILDLNSYIDAVHNNGGLAIVAADVLSLAILKPPGEFGADIVVGSTQRFGVPLGYGGPHAAYLATKNVYQRQMPGRLVGVSHDADGSMGFRLTLQTREQHIRRDRATSNICTAQALLAVVASMYAIYHGPEGIRAIADRVHQRAYLLEQGLRTLGYDLPHFHYFDTLRVPLGNRSYEDILKRAGEHRINIRVLDTSTFCVSINETTTSKDIADLLLVFGGDGSLPSVGEPPTYTPNLARSSAYLTHPIFNRYRSETEMLRYLNQLANRDLSLANSMIPLGSCTMKLNATAEMMPITWQEFGKLHPFVPMEQAEGYCELFQRLEAMLIEITGFTAISLQPNSGAQGEYAGLLVIRRYHQDRGEAHRNVCLIPASAHGTNPASAAMAGMNIKVVKTDTSGNIDVEDLRTHAQNHKDDLAALMITYPSTHGVFEETIREICDIVHQSGGQVYMDGANMNAQVGICRPGDFGADVCHLNLHKTFCIPHGGGGPGMGPIGVATHLTPYLPSHPILPTRGEKSIGAVSAAPWGSPSILPIPYAYIRLMGTVGLRKATEIAILNANYIMRRLEPHFPILYKGKHGLVAHECILDLRPLKATSDITVEDVAKRLIDYGFHAPTVSWPVSGTMMIEPTESESKEELDRFCNALIAIREEIRTIEQGIADRANNVLKRAPHTLQQITSDSWNRPYGRETAAFPVQGIRQNKYWPPVGRIDNVYGDRNIVCACPPIEVYG